MYKMEYYSVIKQKETSPSVTAWIAIEGIILSETRQTEKDKYDLLNQKLHPKMNLWKTQTAPLEPLEFFSYCQGNQSFTEFWSVGGSSG